MAQEHRPLAVGDIFHYFANGAFGRDHYDCVMVIETGPDWIRANDINGDSVFAQGYRKLVFLMSVRDDQIKEGCPLDSEWDSDKCPFSREGAVQLTEGGPFYPEQDQ